MRSQAGLPCPIVALSPPDESAQAALDAWRAAAAEAGLAYADWCETARRRERRMAFAVYRAAADREAVAAEVLARCA
jgi:hypothetical protein